MNDKFYYTLIGFALGIIAFGLFIALTTNTIIQKHIDTHTELKLCEQKYKISVNEQIMQVSYCIIKVETPEIYCTTPEYSKLLTTKEPFCGIIDETSDRYGGIVKINNRWINKYWIERVI